MSISTTIRRAGPFTGNGSTTAFSFAFKVFADTDLQVVQADLLGVEEVLVLDSDYSVALNADQDANPGGTVTLSSALADDFTLAIVSGVPQTQLVVLTNMGAFFPSIVNTALDRLTIIAQQLQEQVDRTIKLPLTSEPGDFELPLPEPNQLLAWNDTGDGVVNIDPADLATVSGYGNARVELFDGDGSTLSFALDFNPGVAANLDVAIDGVVQVAGVDFDFEGTALVFSSAPPDGSVIHARYTRPITPVPNFDDAIAAAAAAAASAAEAAAVVEGAVQEDDLILSTGSALVGHGATGVTVAKVLNELRTLQSAGMIPNDRSAGAATTNTGIWNNTVKAFLEAGGKVEHGPYEYAIDDYLSGPCPAPGIRFAYQTMPKASAWYQRTDNTEILRFNASQSDTGDYETRRVPERATIGGFVATWLNDQPKANTRAIAIALRAAGHIPDGARDLIFGPGLELMNGRDGLAVHPDTVTSAYNFPTWGLQSHAPRFTSGASGSLLRLGNFGTSGGAPAISVYDPYFNGESTDGTVEAMLIKGVSGVFMPNAEFNRSKGTTIRLQSCRGSVFLAPRWELAELSSAGKLVSVEGESSRAVFESPEVDNTTFVIGVGNEAFWFETFDGYAEVRNPIVNNLAVTTGRFTALNPRRAAAGADGRIKLVGQPAATGTAIGDLSKFRWSSNTGNSHALVRGNVHAYVFQKTLAANLAYTPVAPYDPVPALLAPQDGYLIGLKYEFLDSSRAAVTVTAGAGSISGRVNGTVTPTGAEQAFNSGSNASGGEILYSADAGKFLKGDNLAPNIYTDGSFATSGAGTVVVTLLVAFY